MFFNVALDIGGYEIVEEKTASTKYVFGIIGQVKALQIDTEEIVTSQADYRRIFAAYKEGLNATNVFYQVLSFYKVTEGIRNLRSHRRAQLVSKGLKPSEPRERIPSTLDEIQVDSWDKGAFKPLLGKKFGAVLDQYRELIRNAIAHLDPSQNIMDIDRYNDVIVCQKALPVLRYMARELIANDLRLTRTSTTDTTLGIYREVLDT